jgi:hypothetical protein
LIHRIFTLFAEQSETVPQFEISEEGVASEEVVAIEVEIENVEAGVVVRIGEVERRRSEELLKIMVPADVVEDPELV